MLRRLRYLSIALVCFALLPIAAASAEAGVPQFRSFRSSRFELVLVQGGQVAVVGRGETVFPGRQHVVISDLTSDGQVAQTQETVLYDGIVYFREDDSDNWEVSISTSPVEDPTTYYASLAPASDYVMIGKAEIAGVAATQYQAQIRFSDDGPPIAVIDAWIADESGYLVQSQITQSDTDSSGAPITIEIVARSFDFDSAAIDVGQPQVDAPIRGPVPWSAQSGTLGARSPIDRMLRSLLAR